MQPSRNSGRHNPYPGYDNASQHPFRYEGEVDGRLAAKERVLGVRSGDGGAVAIRQEDLWRRRVITFSLSSRRLVAWTQPGPASALDRDEVAAGRDVGATGVFVPLVADCELHFLPAGDDGFTDGPTGSRWNVLGRAVSGPLWANNCSRSSTSTPSGSPGRPSCPKPRSSLEADSASRAVQV